MTFRATPLDFMAPRNHDSVVSEPWSEALSGGTESNEETDSSDSTRKLRLDFSANHSLAFMVDEGGCSTLRLYLVEVQIDLPLSYWEKMSDEQWCPNDIIDRMAQEKQATSKLFLYVDEYEESKQEFFDQSAISFSH